MTNAEKVRSMTDEELADIVFGERYCPPELYCYDCNADTDCKTCRLRWLQEECQ